MDAAHGLEDGLGAPETAPGEGGDCKRGFIRHGHISI